MEFPPSSKNRLVGVHDDGHIIFESEPQVRMTKIGNRGSERVSSEMKYTLSFPYIQYILKKWKGWDNYWSLHLSYTNEPIENLESEVYFPPFLNVYHPTHQVCMNTHNNWINLSPVDILTQYWLSEFHDNGTESYWKCYEYLSKLPMKDLDHWQKMSLDDPSFITDVDWPDKTDLSAILKSKERHDYTCFQVEIAEKE